MSPTVFSKLPRLLALCAGASLLAAAPHPLLAKSRAEKTETQLQTVLARTSDAGLRDFYVGHGGQPLWLDDKGAPNEAATALLQLLGTVERDGLRPERFNTAQLLQQLPSAKKSPANGIGFELAMSRAYADYVEALNDSGDTGILYEHSALRPRALPTAAALQQAATAPSLPEFISQMRWMHPLYSQLREALAAQPALDDAQRRAAEGTLARLRGIPSQPGARYVLVDAASATLWMYENGLAVDSMKVVVGKPEMPTPLMAGYIRHAVFNPYWNVPVDLVRSRLAPNVINQGTAYLTRAGYEVVTSYDADAKVINPRTVNWKKVQSGEVTVRVRQKPGGANAMGTVKYEFPNPLGIYLHDTPDKQLMGQDARQFSSGCIRLEDAARLGRWLLGGELPTVGDAPEQEVDLVRPVPVYVTYLTARPEGATIAVATDVYRRDGLAGGQLLAAQID